MKVLFSHSIPFFLTHGGTQTLTEELMTGLRNRGVEAEPERWWDDQQKGDILHFIARPMKSHVILAKQKGFKVVLTDLLDTVAARSPLKLRTQRLVIRMIQRFAPGMTERVAWDVYRETDAMVFALSHESEVAQYLFDAPRERCHVIPWAMPAPRLVDLAKAEPEEDYLICLASIVPRKNCVLLARAAKDAKVPVVFVGKPIDPNDSYFAEFKSLVDGTFVRYAGFVSEEEKDRLLKRARGFALLSRAESGCVAVYEAAAAGLPLFLTDAPWARTGYPGANPITFVNPEAHDKLVAALQTFYASAHRLSRTTFPVLSWDQVAEKYIAIYRQLLSPGSR